MKASVAIDLTSRRHVVSRYLYSEFAENIGRCIYEGLWVGTESSIPNYDGFRTDVLEALRRLELPLLRWPGGTFSDGYHWEDGVGPRDHRPIRTSVFSERETNEFGTHEFMQLCELLGCDAYIALNLTTGTPQEARDWVEYLTSDGDTTLTRLRAANGRTHPWRIPYFGIGNEAWVDGLMRAEHYADLYRSFAWAVRNIAPPDTKLVACGSHPGIDDRWDRELLASLASESQHIDRYYFDGLQLVDYIALHNYTWVESTLDYTRDDYDSALANVARMQSQIARAQSLCDAYSTDAHRLGVILDEWGIWYRDKDPEKLQFQQSTMLDAVFVATGLHMLHSCSGLHMANLSTLTNVLQALVLTEGPRMLCTPSYHVWRMFMPHRDAVLLASEAEGVSASATLSASGSITLSIVNTSLEEDAEITVTGLAAPPASASILSGANVRVCNTFDDPNQIVPQPLEGTRIPPHSVAVFTYR